jgi:hypothetical protein
MNKVGVILRAHEVFPEERTQPNPISKLIRHHPDKFVLDMREPKHLKMIEYFSKLENVYPMFEIGNYQPTILKQMVMQGIVVLNTTEVHFAVKHNTSTEMKYLIEALVKDLITEASLLGKPTVYIHAPARYLIDNSPARYALVTALNVGLEAHPCFSFTNTKESLAFFKSGAFLAYLDGHEKAILNIQLITDQIEQLEDDLTPFFERRHEVLFTGLNSLQWFMTNSTISEKSVRLNTNEGIIAYAIGIQDRISGWLEPNCVGTVIHKYQQDQIVPVVAFLPNNVAQTSNGDFINLKFFSVEEL